MRILARPRLFAALLCLSLGIVVLVLGMLNVPSWFTPVQSEPTFEEVGLLDVPTTEQPNRSVVQVSSAVPIPEVIVYISGAVARPDVYRLPAGARVKDLVLAAGGLTEAAAPAQINLAQSLTDAGHIHVPTLHEQGVQSTGLSGPSGPMQTNRGLINLNTASAAALEDLPGIGTTLAERIIAWRNDHGPFTAIEQLREVSGIGDKLYSQLAPLVTVGT